MTALLPAQFTLACQGGVRLEVEVGGRARGVVWVDCDARFAVERLARMMRAHLERVVAEATADELAQGRTVVTQELDHQINSIVSAALEHTFVIPCDSTLQLAATLEVLPQLWVARDRPALLYVLIDGLSEYCWADQRHPEQHSNPPSRKGLTPALMTPLQLVLSSLAHVKSTLAPITFVTNWILMPLAVTSRSTTSLGQNFGLTFVAQHLPSPWPAITTLPHVGPPGDPLHAIAHPKTGAGTIALKLHVTCYRLPRDQMKSGTLLREAVKKKREAPKEASGERFVGLVRVAGGKELGAWEYEVEGDTVTG